MKRTDRIRATISLRPNLAKQFVTRSAETETSLNEHLLDAILPDRHHDALRPRIRNFFCVPEFSDFVGTNERTIASELRKQKTIEDCFDVVAELECACLLSRHVRQLDYQVRLTNSNKRLDFVVHLPQSSRVGVEVKRIREPESVTALRDQACFEIPYTYKESYKFTDRLLEALPQLDPHIPNIVFFKISSVTHEPSDAHEALAHIVTHFNQGNDQFFKEKHFPSPESFLEQYRKLSAVVVRTGFTPIAGAQRNDYTRNPLLTNGDARLSLPEGVAEMLRHADIAA